MPQGDAPRDVSPATAERDLKHVHEQRDRPETHPSSDVAEAEQDVAKAEEEDETESARRSDENIPRLTQFVLGERYLLQREIGRGGLGIIYSAMDTNLNRLIALKVAHPSIDSKYADRIIQAARLVASIQHERIARVYDVHANEDTPFIAMEMVIGSTLSTWMSVHQLSILEIVDIAIQIAEGLAEMHANGVIHRDLKPETVMLTSSGGIKLIGFGIAIDARVASAQSEATLVGTPGYMAPEQLRGGAFDPSVDVFALGVIVHELVTGRRRRDEFAASEVFWAALHEGPDLGSRAWMRAPKRLREHTTRMLSREPSERFANGAEVLAALRELTPSKPRRELSVPISILQSSRISPQNQEHGRILRNRALGWGIAVAFGALIGTQGARIAELLHESSKIQYLLILVGISIALMTLMRAVRSRRTLRHITHALMHRSHRSPSVTGAELSSTDLLRGIATTLDIGATRSRSTARDRYLADANAIRDDWVNIAEDIKQAIRIVILSEK